MDSFKIKTDLDLSWIENRNGFHPIQGVYAQVSTGGVILTGIGISNKVLRGLIGLTAAEMDHLAVEWLKRRSENEGATAIIVLPQEAWNTLYETLQMDAGSSAFDPDLRTEISTALDEISEFNSVVGIVASKPVASVEIEANTYGDGHEDYLQLWYHNDALKVHALVMTSDTAINDMSEGDWNAFVLAAHKWAKKRHLEVVSEPSKSDYEFEE